MSWSWHFTLTQIWKQTASPSYGCVLVWMILHDISICIWYLKGNQSYVVYSQQYTFLQAVTRLAKLQPNYLLLNLLSEFGKSLSSPNQDEIRRKAVQYLVQVLKPNSTWIFLGMKCTTKVKSVISIPYHLPVLIYICTFWGACIHNLYTLSSKRKSRPN